MTQKTKPEALEDADLDAVQGGGGATLRQSKDGATKFLDEADAVKSAPDGKQVVVTAGGGNSI